MSDVAQWTKISQSAAASFNPARQIMEQVIETCLSHGLCGKAEAEKRAVALFRNWEAPRLILLGTGALSLGVGVTLLGLALTGIGVLFAGTMIRLAEDLGVDVPGTRGVFRIGAQLQGLDIAYVPTYLQTPGQLAWPGLRGVTGELQGDKTPNGRVREEIDLLGCRGDVERLGSK